MEKQDVKYTFKECRSHFPRVAFVNGHPFYVENRDGNIDRLKNGFDWSPLHSSEMKSGTVFKDQKQELRADLIAITQKSVLSALLVLCRIEDPLLFGKVGEKVELCIYPI